MVLEVIGFCLALFVGLVLGTLGSGGSILAVPILVVFFKLEPQDATSYSLFIVGVTALFGAIQHFRSRLINPKTALLFGLPAVASITLTRLYLINRIPEKWVIHSELALDRNMILMTLFGILMILASFPMIRGRKEKQAKKNRPLILVVFGVIIGIISGLVGAGGGFLIIPSLSIFMRVPIKSAIATSIVIVAINSLSGFAVELLKAEEKLHWEILLGFTLIAALGLLLGLKVNHLIQSDRLRKGFGYFVLLIGITILLIELVPRITA